MLDNEGDEEISKVLFELASNRRASILFEVERKNLKMQQIAKSLDMNVTETFRHLQRLNDAKLVEKQVDGTYATTSLGNLAIGLLSSLNFILKHGDYFLGHEVSCLPYEFVNRLGELADAEFCGDTVTTLNRVREIVYEADEYIWTMAEQVESTHRQSVNEKVTKGLDFRFIMQEDLARTVKITPDVEHLKQRRYLAHVCLTLLVTEKEASISLRRRSGETDYIGFIGNGERFRKWTCDLFMYYWERAEPWQPKTQKP
ncbi:DUF1724 domain-containing protein [Candidatus Thorarchaeota archaeon]|nr:MAG: DUF1724 domain-containing protein [Candidatus Thorarchaeota archaeon]